MWWRRWFAGDGTDRRPASTRSRGEQPLPRPSGSPPAPSSPLQACIDSLLIFWRSSPCCSRLSRVSTTTASSCRPSTRARGTTCRTRGSSWRPCAAHGRAQHRRQPPRADRASVAPDAARGVTSAVHDHVAARASSESLAPEERTDMPRPWPWVRRSNSVCDVEMIRSEFIK